jgi:hypothetical protein
MLVRAMVCASLALALFNLPSATASSVNYPQVHRVNCSTSSGSAFLTDRGWLSVAHVTNNSGCEIEGHPIVSQQDGEIDFSRVNVSLTGRGMKVNCDGFKVGTYVWSIGYAGGFEWQTMTRHLVTWKVTDDGRRVLLGPAVIPGMSGGPVLNAEGEVVGTVNRYLPGAPLSFSQPLSGTSLCLNKR